METGEETEIELQKIVEAIYEKKIAALTEEYEL